MPAALDAGQDAVRRLVYRSCLVLDDEDFEAYLALCTPDFHYRITAFSPELDKDMVWLDLRREDLSGLFEMVPQHVRLEGQLTRQATVYLIDPGPDERHLSVLTALTVVHTELDGTSRLFAVGRYHDVIETGAAAPRLRSRHVRLTTRNLGPGSHLPL